MDKETIHWRFLTQIKQMTQIYSDFLLRSRRIMSAHPRNLRNLRICVKNQTHTTGRTRRVKISISLGTVRPDVTRVIVDRTRLATVAFKVQLREV